MPMFGPGAFKRLRDSLRSIFISPTAIAADPANLPYTDTVVMTVTEATILPRPGRLIAYRVTSGTVTITAQDGASDAISANKGLAAINAVSRTAPYSSGNLNLPLSTGLHVIVTSGTGTIEWDVQ